MKIRFLAGLALLALALASCNPSSVTTAIEKGYTLATSDVSQGKAAALHSSIQAIERTNHGYVVTCTTPGNSGIIGCDKATVGKVAKLIAGIRAADDTLFQQIKIAQAEGTGVTVAMTVYNAAIDAINAYYAANPPVVASAS